MTNRGKKTEIYNIKKKLFLIKFGERYVFIEA